MNVKRMDDTGGVGAMEMPLAKNDRATHMTKAIVAGGGEDRSDARQIVVYDQEIRIRARPEARRGIERMSEMRAFEHHGSDARFRETLENARKLLVAGRRQRLMSGQQRLQAGRCRGWCISG